MVPGGCWRVLWKVMYSALSFFAFRWTMNSHTKADVQDASEWGKGMRAHNRYNMQSVA